MPDLTIPEMITRAKVRRKSYEIGRSVKRFAGSKKNLIAPINPCLWPILS